MGTTIAACLVAWLLGYAVGKRQHTVIQKNITARGDVSAGTIQPKRSNKHET